MLQQITTYAAHALLRDVLELRHRLPAHWDAVLTGRVEGWKARQVARATHRLRPQRRSVPAAGPTRRPP